MIEYRDIDLGYLPKFEGGQEVALIKTNKGYTGKIVGIGTVAIWLNNIIRHTGDDIPDRWALFCGGMRSWCERLEMHPNEIIRQYVYQIDFGKEVPNHTMFDLEPNPPKHRIMNVPEADLVSIEEYWDMAAKEVAEFETEDI